MNCHEDPSILKAKKTMNKVLKPLDEHNAKIRADLESKMKARRRAGKGSPARAESGGGPDVATSEQDIQGNRRKVDPTAVRESLKDAGVISSARREKEEKVA